MSYIEIPANALLTELKAIGKKVTAAGGSCRQFEAGEEVAFALTLPRAHGGAQIRIFTSVKRGAATARGCGQDAIRIVYGTTADGEFRPLSKSRRVFRTAPQGAPEDRVLAFLTRFSGVVREVYAQAARTPRCPKCDRHMVRRNGPRGDFFGCLGYPSCRATREVAPSPAQRLASNVVTPKRPQPQPQPQRGGEMPRRKLPPAIERIRGKAAERTVIDEVANDEPRDIEGELAHLRFVGAVATGGIRTGIEPQGEHARDCFEAELEGELRRRRPADFLDEPLEGEELCFDALDEEGPW